MFPDIGGTELIIVAVVALLVFKPQDLPKVMRTFGEFMNKARRMASDFRATFDDMARQSELEDLRKEVEAMRAKASDPMGLNSTLNEMGSEISQSLDQGLGDPNFDYGYSHTDDNSVPWDPSAMPSEEETAVGAKPKKAAPRKATVKSTAAESTQAKSPAPKSKIAKPAAARTAKAKLTVEGGPKPQPTVVASAKPKRAPAKKAV